jgi:hypothetical protein
VLGSFVRRYSGLKNLKGERRTVIKRTKALVVLSHGRPRLISEVGPKPPISSDYRKLGHRVAAAQATAWGISTVGPSRLELL